MARRIPPRTAGRALLLVAAAAAVLLLALCTGSHAVAGNELDGLSSDGGFVPLEFGSLGSVDLASSDSMSLSTSPTDRELFNDMSGATGLPEPPKPPLCIGLNLVASLPCAIYLCRPTLLEGISIILNPSSPEALAGLGDVDLKLTAEYGAISFTTTEGVTFTGPSVNAVQVELVGSLTNVNAALSTLLFGPYFNFYGYAFIHWQLSNHGPIPVPPTNGTITIVVGSYSLAPSLVPLSDDGVLADFDMNENSVSKEFAGVAINDPAQTAQTIYKVSIQGFEGALNLASEVGLTFDTDSKPEKLLFECLPEHCATALASFTFSTSSFGPYQGNAGFIIVVTNTFHKSTGFIQGVIRNHATHRDPIPGALAPCRIDSITSTSARVTWDALPDGFVESGATPLPTGYLMQYSPTGSSGPWYTGYEGDKTVQVMTGLQPASRYFCQVIMINAGGQSPASPAVDFTTLPGLPGAPTAVTVSGATATAITLSWTAPTQTGGGVINIYRIIAQPTAVIGTALGKTTTISTGTSVTISGLQGSTAYTFSVFANNAAGAGPAGYAQGSTLGTAPVIVSYVASGPSNGANVYSTDVKLSIGFSLATNKPAVATKEQIDGLFYFSPSIGKSYSGAWSADGKTVQLTILDAGTASPVIGVATVTVKGVILAADGNSAPMVSISPALSGSFGSTGSLVPSALITKPPVTTETDEGVPTSLSVTINIAPLFADGSYYLVATVLMPRIPGSFLSGTGFPNQQAWVVTASGSPTQVQSALDTLLYTPAPGYSGPASFKFELFNKVNNELLSSLVMALNVRARMALPTVTAPDSIDVILEQYTSVTGLQVGYTDASTASSTSFAVTVSTTHTGSAVFSSPPASVTFTPPQGTEALSHELTGSLSALNAALAKLQVKFTFSSNSAQSNYAPDPYQLVIEVASMGAAAADGSRPNATRIVSANINCNTAAVTAPTVTGARLDNSLNSITVSLDLPISDSFLATPVFECNTLLDSASVALLGATPVCHWVSTVAFRIDLGMGATFVPGTHSLTIPAGKLQRCLGGSNPSPAQTFPVAMPLASKAPRVFISGPKVTSLCNPLVLQGISAMVGGRAPIYTWQLPRNLNPAFLPTDLSKPILEVAPEAFNDGGNFTFSLTVGNYLGQTSAVSTKIITATNLPVPLIFPTGVTELTSTCTSPIRLYNSITVNPCFNEPLKPMIFQWSIKPALLDSSHIVLTGANLVLPRNVLLPGTQYVATLRVAIATNPALATEIDYVINVATNELKPYIAGGEWRKVRVDAMDWTLDGSLSSDADAKAVNQMPAVDPAIAAQYAADQYTYSWACTTPTGDKCFSALTGQPLVLVEHDTITMAQGSLRVGLYTFTLTYTHTPSKRSASASTMIAVREGVNPTAYGALGTVDVLLDAHKRAISPQDRLNLVATLASYYTDRTDDLVYTWSVQGGGSSGISTATLENNPGVEGFGTANLVLNAAQMDGFFVPGTDYHFQVTVAHKDDPNQVVDAGQALVWVRVNALPQCDSFVAAPAGDAIAFNSSITVNALSCYDSDSDQLLSYTFFRLDEQGNRFDLLPKSNSPLGRVPLVPTGGGDKSLLTVGVTVSDHRGGRVEYTKEVKINPNPLVRAASGKPAIDGVAALKGLYDKTWAANAAISGDTETLLVIQAAILTELNELVYLRGSSNAFSSAEAAALLSYKKSLQVDIGKDSSLLLPSIQVMQAMVELLEDAAHVDQTLLASAIDFVAARAPLESGANQELLSTYARVVKQALDYIMRATGAVSSAAGRRLFGHAAMETLEMGVAQGTPTTANPADILASALATLNVLAQDLSAHALNAPHDTIPITVPLTQGFSGAVGRGAVGQSTNVSTLSGYGVLVSPTAFSSLAPNTYFDIGVWGLSPAPFLGMISPAEATTIVSGGASVAAFLPEYLKTSTAVTTFATGDVEALIPINMDLADCVQGPYTPPTTDDAASGNVFGNMCKIGCKVWNGQTLSDAGATMVALYPLSKHVVCGLSGPGVAVAYNTRLSEPYVIPGGPDQTGLDGPSAQPNGLPWGVVRASLLLQPAPSIYDLNAFKDTFSTDMGSLTGVPVSRLVVRATSTSGEATTVIWDFLPANDASPTVSQDLYDGLIELEQPSFNDKPVLKNTVLPTISQMCDDGVYRHKCHSGGRAAWELPVIISVCCAFFLCCIACIVYACIRLRRSRAAGGDSLKMAPPMMGTDLVPAKKFVYTAPNSEENSSVEDKVSEVTIMAKGLEFEPSAAGGGAAGGSGSHNSADGSDPASKNRLSAKFPNKAGAAAAGAAGAAGGSGNGKEESKSSHHFYYVDESAKAGGAPTPSGSRRNSRNESGIAFSLNGGGARNELSGSGNSRSGSGSGNSQSQPGTPASDQRRRRGSAPGVAAQEDAAAAAAASASVDKAALPVVRPGGK